MASPAGCNKTFVEDVNGDIPCKDDDDCPQNLNWWKENGGYDGHLFGVCNTVEQLCDIVEHPCIYSSRLKEYGFRKEQQNCLDLFRLCGGSSCSCCVSKGVKPSLVSPVAGVTVRSSLCSFCKKTHCPPDKPCDDDGKCSRARCTRRGRCWCPVQYKNKSGQWCKSNNDLRNC